MRHRIALLCVLLSPLLPGGAVRSAEGFLTRTFGNTERCDARGTLRSDESSVRFDLSSVSPATKVWRAVLRVNPKGHPNGAAVRLVPAGLAGAKALALRPPRFEMFDATECVRAWVARPGANQGLTIEQSGGLRFGDAVLEVSIAGPVAEPLPTVTQLKALYQCGQTFLTWREIEEPLGEDAPSFEDFEKKVLKAGEKRNLVYRIYRHTQPVTAENLGKAELIHEIPAVLSAWNLLEIQVTEHPNQGTPTKNSTLRPGCNLALRHVMHRYRITPGGEPLARGTALAVLTARTAAARYYAVTAAADGRESVVKLDTGASLANAVQEKPNVFPAIIYQRSHSLGPAHKDSPTVDVYNSWLEPPYHNTPLCSETYIVRWQDLSPASGEKPLPLRVEHGTYGSTATEMGSPSWHGARNYVKGAFTIGLSEGDLWQGFHECIGTLKGYGEGVVHNYPQRRVLAAAHWALAQPEFFLDPERVCLTAQFAHWGLRHGDLFAAVASNGHGNLAIGKVPQQHGWKWGPYPKGSPNWLGMDQWDYMDLPKWIREHPKAELPYWLCHPAYGAYPAHTVGDFGFMPWPEMIHAMVNTKRAFAATWSFNGPGPVGPLYALVPRIKLHQSLPAFGNCSLDHSIGDGDHDEAQKGGGINLYQLWEPETILDQPDRWEITLTVRPDCASSGLTTDVTPRRCQQFKAKPGETFRWSLVRLEREHGAALAVSAQDAKPLQEGTATADRWGLVTVEKLELAKDKRRLAVWRSP